MEQAKNQQTRDYFLRILALTALTTSLLLSQGAFAGVLRTAAQDSPPKFISNADNSAGGISVDVMHELTKIDPSIVFSGENNFLPLRRIEASLRNGSIDVFFGFIRNQHREQHYIFIDPPIYHVADVVVVRQNDPIIINSIEELKETGNPDINNPSSVLITMGVAQGEQLKAMGVQIDDGAKTLDANLKKLLAHRGRFLFQSELEITAAIKSLPPEQQKQLKILPTKFNLSGRYVAFSKNVSTLEIKKIQSALEKLEKSGVLEKIYRKYNHR